MEEFNTLIDNDFQLLWKNINYSVILKDQNNKEKQILNNVSSYAKSRQVTAIMGPSGCGKSSLLNFLTDRINFKRGYKHTGEIYVNNKPKTFSYIASVSSYVMQDDLLYDVLTPKETFLFAIKMKKKKQEKQYETIVSNLLEELKLTKCRDTIIGNANVKGLSGGERKRTSIGVEILMNSPIMFMDEPTSGLDSQTSYIIVNLLKQLADLHNKLIILSIHQPSSNIFNLFDKLIILSNGQSVYQGNPKGVLPFFKEAGHPLETMANPADAFMHVMEHLNIEKKNDLPQKFVELQEKTVNNEINAIIEDKGNFPELPQKNESGAGFCTSLKLLMDRQWINMKRNPFMIKLRFIITLYFAFIICSVFNFLKNDEDGIRGRMGFIFFFTINNFMTQIFSFILAFPMERGVFLRETSSKLYTTLPYFISKNLIETPFGLLATLLLSIIVYYIVGMREEVGYFFIFNTIFVIHAFTAQSMGLMLGCLFSNLSVAMVLASFILLPFMLFSGFLINTENMPVWLAWIRFISPFYYTISAAVHNEFDGNAYLDKDMSRLFNLDISLWNCEIIMVCYGIGMRIMAFFFLKLLIKKTG